MSEIEDIRHTVEGTEGDCHRTGFWYERVSVKHTERLVVGTFLLLYMMVVDERRARNMNRTTVVISGRELERKIG